MYRITDGGEPFFQRDRIEGTLVTDGEGYTVRERCDVPIVEGGVGDAECAQQLVRTDAGQRLSPCPLDEPVNTNFEGEGDIVICDEDRTSAAYRFFGPVPQDNGPTIPADTVKTFGYFGLASPVGLTVYVLDLGPAPAISGAGVRAPRH